MSSHKHTPQQEAIFDWFKTSKINGTVHRNVVMKALAGTGKTYSNVMGLSLAPEKNILFTSFNRRIVREADQKVQEMGKKHQGLSDRVKVRSFNQVGCFYMFRHWNGFVLDDDRSMRIAQQLCMPLSNEQWVQDQLTALVAKLHVHGKDMVPFATSGGELEEIAIQMDCMPSVELEREGWDVSRVCDLALCAMERSCVADGTYSFSDQVFVPVRNKWIFPRFDLVVIDEAQDANRAQLELAVRAVKKTGRIAAVGDSNQAIYAWRGADVKSLDRMQSELRAGSLGLTVTFRCPQTHVKLAQEFVPEYTAAPEAPDGVVTTVAFDKLHEQVRPGNFVVSRKNAPLARACLRLLKHGITARIEGREVARGIVGLIDKLKAKSVSDFIDRLNKWTDREVKRLEKLAKEKKSAAARVEYLLDQRDVLLALAEGKRSVKDLKDFVNGLFVDEAGNDKQAVVLYSVHKVKGLETDRVFVLGETLRRDDQEERNICYVAVTRAKHELTWVTGIA